MTFPRCDTCEHWVAENFDPEDSDPINRRPSPGEGWGACSIANGRGGKAETTDTLVFAQDASSYRATLSTHRTFGCVMHQAVKEFSPRLEPIDCEADE